MAVSRSGEAGVAAGDTADADRARLHQLGYKQELKRGLSLMSNFAFSFSIISVMAGVTTTYNGGLRYGGPASMTLGWLVVAAFNGCVALSMAEICSAYPTSGGLYYWSAKLAGKKWAPLASWVTGWFNIVGQWATTTSTDFSLAQLVQVIVLLGTGGANGGGYLASKYVVLAIHAFFLVLHGLINSLPIRWLSWFGKLGAFWNTAGAFTLVILIPTVAKERASAKFIFTHFNDDNGMGIHGKAYILALGLLTSQYSLLGYDTSAHMIEETKNADWSGPMGIITSVALSTTFGWIFLVALTSIVTDIPYLLDPANDAGGYAVAQALYTAFDRRYGSGVGGLVCVAMVAVGIFFAGAMCIASNSRFGHQSQHPFLELLALNNITILYTRKSKDGVRLLEGQGDAILARVATGEQERGASQRRLALRRRRLHNGSHGAQRFPHGARNTQTLDVHSLSLRFSFLYVQSLGSQVAFQAMVSISTLGQYIAYALPIFFRVTTSRKSFVPGPFHLGRYGVFVGWAAVLWVAFLTVLFSLPVAYPVAQETFNYTPVAVGGVLLLSLAAWVFSARFWFKGPITNVDS
uniref:Uncharacterized protein n=1 Tax=Avena sativa TaxID=4498 RepID=A0ACD5XFY4_AVESA